MSSCPRLPPLTSMFFDNWCSLCSYCRGVCPDETIFGPGCQQCEAGKTLLDELRPDEDLLTRCLVPISRVFSYTETIAYLNESIVEWLATSPTSTPRQTIGDFERVLALVLKRSSVVSSQFLFLNGNGILEFDAQKAKDKEAAMEKQVEARLRIFKEAERKTTATEFELKRVQGKKRKSEDKLDEAEKQLREFKEKLARLTPKK
ncbi:hypothetical protein B0T22DRAFT_538992 [Podospora appendiculata]|uniref:Uncharacterized protein n=1 Tax=Podospora appendiculata TaxID=314037 RepID=A0AAE0X3C6_9PEZI|nr:hypothetical protein B0T22DRAFT_538992 [Podospora appendiculata]